MADFTYDDFLSWGGDETQQEWYQNADLDTGDAGGANWLQSLLGGAQGVASFLGKNAGTLGPLASILGGGLNARTGADAAQTAAGQQAQALNRGIDLQTAQWLQQQQNQAPWMEAGKHAVSDMRARMTWEGPQRPGATSAISGADYQMPGTTPGWTPQSMDAQAYKWTPGQGPQASQYGYQGPQAVNAQDYTWAPGEGASAQAHRWTPQEGARASDYRYTPGQTPDAAQYPVRPAATLPGRHARHAGLAAHRAASARSGPWRGLSAERSAQGPGRLRGGARAAAQWLDARRASAPVPGPRQPGVRQCLQRMMAA